MTKTRSFAVDTAQGHLQVDSLDRGDEGFSWAEATIVEIDHPPHEQAFDTSKFYKIPLTAARPIDQQYVTADQEVVTMRKPPEELRKAAWSLDNCPLTLGHPSSRIVDSVDLVHGFVRNPRWDADEQRLRADAYVPVTDTEAKAFIEDNNDVSIGFWYDKDYDASDVDAYQRNILADHLAIVDEGRCSREDGCGLAADSVTAVIGDDSCSCDGCPCDGVTIDKDVSDIDLTPPESAQNAAQRVLDARDDEDKDVQGMTDAGWSRAEQLASGDALEPSDIVSGSGSMAPWWSRHASHTVVSTEDGLELKREDDTKWWKDNSYVAGLGWGGVTGYRWAIRKGNEIKRARGEDPDYSVIGGDSAIVMDAAVHVNVPTFDGTVEEGGDRPRLEDFAEAYDFDSDVRWRELPVAQRVQIADHFLLATDSQWPPAAFNDLKLAVVTPDGELAKDWLRKSYRKAPQVDGLYEDGGYTERVRRTIDNLFVSKFTADAIPAIDGSTALDTVLDGTGEFHGEVSFAADKSVAGVTFNGKRDGKLNESEIPNDDYESHYLFPADTKSDSSYPVVDGEGYLRRGNVASAYQLGARGGVSEETLHRKLRKLNKEFDNPPIDNFNTDSNMTDDDPQNGSLIEVSDLTVDAVASKNDSVAELVDERDRLAEDKEELQAQIDKRDERIDELEEELESYRADEKQELVDEILEYTEAFDEDDLMEKDIDELETRLEVAKDAASELTQPEPDEGGEPANDSGGDDPEFEPGKTYDLSHTA